MLIEDSIKKQLENYNLRLCHLKEKQALLGVNVDPVIPIEIKKIVLEIENLEKQLWESKSGETSNLFSQTDTINSNEEKRASKVSLSSGKSIVEFKVVGAPSNFTPEQKSNLLIMLAISLQCPIDAFNILSIRAGSIILEIEMPNKIAYRLLALYRKNDTAIQNLGIEEVNLITSRLSLKEKIISFLFDRPLEEEDDDDGHLLLTVKHQHYLLVENRFEEEEKDFRSRLLDEIQRVFEKLGLVSGHTKMKLIGQELSEQELSERERRRKKSRKKR